MIQYKMSRPRKYNTKEELIAVLDEYIKTCRVPTVEGMARALGVTRPTLINYSKEEEFFSTISDYKAYINEFLMEGLLLNELHAQGTMFNLRNNYGYDAEDSAKDKSPMRIQIERIKKS